MQHMHGSHNIYLVALSYFIAFMASITALDIARRINYSKGWNKKLWLLSGSSAMGIGIWGMHFVAMLAFKLPYPIKYNVFIVILSIIVAIVASLCGLYFTSTENTSFVKLGSGGIFMGIGICSMHYIGMDAMEGVHITYDPLLFALSIFIAIGASIVALMLAFQFRENQKGIISIEKLSSGLIMGFAIAGMHYTGMAAASFVPNHEELNRIETSSTNIHTIATFVSIGTIIILGITIAISTMLDRRLKDERAFKLSILESVIDCVMIVDKDGHILECNPAVTRTFGYSQEHLIGQNMEKTILAQPLVHQGKASFHLGKRMELIGVRKDGNELIIEMTVTRIKKDGPPVFTVYIRDVTEAKKTEDTIRKLAYNDTLTGLPNRRFFHTYILKSLKDAEKNKSKVAVLFLDLDRFKMINDSLGHDFGDLLLIDVAERLQECIGNNAMVSRNGGDEFTIFLPDTNEQEAKNIANQIIHAITRPYLINKREIFITTSIGLAMYPRDGMDKDTLIKHADTAMYDAKYRGKNRLSLFHQESDRKNKQNLMLETELRRALEQQEFVLYYQPRLHIKTGEIIGVEALIRWNHPEKGILSPGQFIPQAEESGLIIPIGNWVLKTAIAQCKLWQENLLPIQMSVNLSALQFKQPDIVQIISEALEKVQLEPSLLNLEITESMAMDMEHSGKVLEDLKKLGIHISLDDFGTGYSSLGYLRNMPIDHLKIDRLFMSQIQENSSDATIVKAIISMAQSLGINVIAEGVEEENQLSFLKQWQCNEMQGFLFSPPIPPKDLEKLFGESRGIITHST
jgi:diguanylate cyclase